MAPPWISKFGSLPTMADFSLRVDLALNGSVHTVTVPTDGQEDALQLQDIMQLHLETRKAGNTCEDTEWLHMMLVQRDILCPCLHDCFDSAHMSCTVLCNGSCPDKETADSSWYPTSCVDSDTTCCICQAPVDPRAETTRQLACGHLFHRKCICRWLRAAPRCPLCNATEQP